MAAQPDGAHEGELAVRAAFAEALFIRPAVMFGPDDTFLTTILKLLRQLPVYPMFGRGRTRLQPAYVEDVAEAIGRTMQRVETPATIFEFGGPRVYSYEAVLRAVAHKPCDDPRLASSSVRYQITRRREVSIMRIRHWQDVASLLVGVWLVLSPFALGFAGAAVGITIVLGLSVILFAVEGFVIPSYLEEWGEILIGLALLVVPWTIGYEPELATVSSMVSGILVILFAIWELLTDRDFITWWHDRWHHPAS